MLSSKKIAAVAGVLGSFALIGVGAGQAFGQEAAGMCADDGMGNVRCADVSKSKLTTDKRGNIVVFNDSTQTCPATNSQVNCVSDVVVPRKKA
jgi:hypothetical protein